MIRCKSAQEARGVIEHLFRPLLDCLNDDDETRVRNNLIDRLVNNHPEGLSTKDLVVEFSMAVAHECVYSKLPSGV